MSILFTPSSDLFLSDIFEEDIVMTPEAFLNLNKPVVSYNNNIYSIDSTDSLYEFVPFKNTQTIPPLTVNLEYGKPLISVYETIDTNPSVRLKLTNYYFDILRDDWLLDELNDILNYLVVEDNKITLIKNIDDYKPTNILKDSDQIAEKKIKFIEKNIFTKYDLVDLLNKFTTQTKTKWVNLPENEFYLKQAIKHSITKKIKKMLSNDRDDKKQKRIRRQ